MTDAPRASLTPVESRVPRVYVTVCDLDGWDIYVEIDGSIVMTEHVTDWHRVERRQAILAADLARARARRAELASAA